MNKEDIIEDRIEKRIYPMEEYAEKYESLAK